MHIFSLGWSQTASVGHSHFIYPIVLSPTDPYLHSIFLTFSLNHLTYRTFFLAPFTLQAQKADCQPCCQTCHFLARLLRLWAAVGTQPHLPSHHPRRGSCDLRDIKHIPGAQPSCKVPSLSLLKQCTDNAGF